jgi:hypothetical protein
MCTEHEQPEFLRLIFSDLLGYTRSIEVGYDRLDEVVNHGLVIDGSSVPGYATVNESDGIRQRHSYYVGFMRCQESFILETPETSFEKSQQSRQNGA